MYLNISSSKDMFNSFKKKRLQIPSPCWKWCKWTWNLVWSSFAHISVVLIKIFAGAMKGDCNKELFVIRAGMLLTIRRTSCHCIYFLYSIMNMNFSGDVKFKPSKVNKRRKNSTNWNCHELLLHVQLLCRDMFTKVTSSYKHFCRHQTKNKFCSDDLGHFSRYMYLSLSVQESSYRGVRIE